MASPFCPCGNTTFESATSCYLCLASYQRNRPSRSTGTHTPPPTTMLSSQPDQQRRQSRRRPSPHPRDTTARTALATAFNCDEDQPSLWPASFYRTPARSQSRSQRSTGATTPMASPPAGVANQPPRGSIDGLSSERRSSGATTGERTRAGTPERSSSGFEETARAYSPMSAGFARLNAGRERFATSNGSPKAADQARTLEARMFGGSA